MAASRSRASSPTSCACSPTALAVILGVAFMAGHVRAHRHDQQDLRQPLRRRLREHRRSRARPEAAQTSDFGRAQRPRSPPRSSTTVAERRRVSAAAGGTCSGYAQHHRQGRQGPRRSGQGRPRSAAAGPTPELDPCRSWPRARRPPADDEVVIDKGSANDGDFAVGDQVTVLARAGRRRSRSSASRVRRRPTAWPARRSPLFDVATAQTLLGRPRPVRRHLGQVADRACPRSELAATASRRRSPDRASRCSPARRSPKENQSDIKQGLLGSSTSSCSSSPASPCSSARSSSTTRSRSSSPSGRRELALLRAIGASRRQVLASVLVEGVAVGLIASLVGLGARRPRRHRAQGGCSPRSASTSRPAASWSLPRTVIVALVVGVMVTVVSAFCAGPGVAGAAGRGHARRRDRHVGVVRKRIVLGLVGCSCSAWSRCSAGGSGQGGGQASARWARRARGLHRRRRCWGR